MSAGDWIFIFQSTELANVVTLDGHLVDWSELVILPPSHHFTFVVNVPVSWIAMSVPTPMAEKVLSSAGTALGNGRLTAKVPEFSMRQLVKLAHDSPSIDADGQQGKDAIETALPSSAAMNSIMCGLRATNGIEDRYFCRQARSATVASRKIIATQRPVGHLQSTTSSVMPTMRPWLAYLSGNNRDNSVRNCQVGAASGLIAL
jgi:hypothetical protein